MLACGVNLHSEPNEVTRELVGETLANSVRQFIGHPGGHGANEAEGNRTRSTKNVTVEGPGSKAGVFGWHLPSLPTSQSMLQSTPDRGGQPGR